MVNAHAQPNAGGLKFKWKSSNFT